MEKQPDELFEYIVEDLIKKAEYIRKKIPNTGSITFMDLFKIAIQLDISETLYELKDEIKDLRELINNRR